MTREEAIKVLNKLKYPYNCKARKLIISNVERENEALEMAIKALSQEPTIGQLFSCEEIEELRSKIWKQVEQEPKSGKWIDYSDEGYVECPFCGHATTCEDNIDELHYCFYCGARMESEE